MKERERESSYVYYICMFQKGVHTYITLSMLRLQTVMCKLMLRHLIVKAAAVVLSGRYTLERHCFKPAEIILKS